MHRSSTHTHMYKFQHIGETKCYIETGNNTNKNENEDHKRAQKLNALAYVCSRYRLFRIPFSAC